jgi:hypothetical protein
VDRLFYPKNILPNRANSCHPAGILRKQKKYYKLAFFGRRIFHVR